MVTDVTRVDYTREKYDTRVVLDQDMRPDDIIAILERLRFSNSYRVIKIDDQVRDYLVAALRRRT
jgi:hypothetical protein